MWAKAKLPIDINFGDIDKRAIASFIDSRPMHMYMFLAKVFSYR